MTQSRTNDDHAAYAVHNMVARPPEGNSTYRPVLRGAEGAISQMKMVPISPLTDFSFDFQDLLFTPVTAKDERQ